ncbi:response regulator transcription factor [Agathobaculum desmolans]|uniref:response regulator transcription factor n=1 Tax=Agathobaculum desmolans TaxID=39484 RepID=UPI00248D8471|nr:response regulator [Agathobaculum desmolans]
MRRWGIVVVDDDAVMRLGMKTLIPWEDTEFDLLGEAENGREALELIQKCRPSIVITDMKMPIMNGVELIRALREQNQPPMILALSSYDDYELVRQAMRLGTADYLLKMDLSPEMLLQTLRSITATSAKPQETGVQLHALRTQLVKNMISRFFVSDKDLLEQMQQARVTFAREPVWVMVLRSRLQMVLDDDEAQEEQYRTLCLSVINIAEEIVQDCLDGFCVEGYDGAFYILGTLREEFAQPEERLLRLCERLSRMIEQYLDVTVYIGIASSGANIDGLFHACRYARTAARQAQRQNISVLHYQVHMDMRHSEGPITEDIAQQAKRYIDTHYSEKIILTELSAQLGITPSYLSSLMKRQLGMAFSEYIMSVRMEQASKLLSVNRLRINEVAAAVGYDNLFYFSKLFKRFSGMSPRDFRHHRMGASNQENTYREENENA